MNINKNKIINILLFVVIIILAFGLFLFLGPKDVQEEEITWNETEMNFSRISFFNTSNVRASLAIPDYWEGRYRIKDEGTTVKFLNIDDPQNSKELFVIRQFKIGDEIGEEWVVLEEKNGLIFAYELSTGNGEDLKKNEENINLLKEVELVLDTFKLK